MFSVLCACGLVMEVEGVVFNTIEFRFYMCAGSFSKGMETAVNISSHKGL